MSKKVKLFPRNLTAKAEELIKGNPVSSRLESGVDNCYPGLEFDQRNLDSSFFPGLNIEYHRGSGAKVISVTDDSLPYNIGLRQKDVDENGVYVWAIVGVFGSSTDDLQLLGCTGLNGLEVWRRVHDLNSGRIAIVIGVGDGFSSTITSQQFEALQKSLTSDDHTVFRNENNQLVFATISSEREIYLDENGVINPEVYKPGELTKTLCSPWQHDFRDCGCFYWAANKPDIVTSSDGNESMLNFMRKDRNLPQQENPLVQWNTNLEYGYHDLANGEWNNIPVIVNDRESEIFEPHQPNFNDLMTKDQVINELKYLASVEHALCVEYLYAHYSINAPAKLDENATDEVRHKFAAAREVLSIAIDEMRHLRWVNEALNILGETPVVERAEFIHRTMQRPFELKPLTKEQLQWFIDVEKPSQDLNQAIDGMYVKLLLSVERQPEVFVNHERLVHLFKLIIDEGEDHYQRFLSIKNHLKNLDETEYLRSTQEPDNDVRLKALQDLADQNYAVMLGTLSIAFSFADESNGQLLEEARRAMFNLHDTAHLLGLNETEVRFNLPEMREISLRREDLEVTLDLLRSRFNAVADDVKNSVNESESAMVLRQQAINDQIFDRMKTIIDTF